MVTLALDRRAIGLGQNGLHFLRFQIARRFDRCFFHGNVQNLGALLDGRRLAVGDIAEEAAQRGQAAITRSDRISTFLLSMLQEGADFGGRQIRKECFPPTPWRRRKHLRLSADERREIAGSKDGIGVRDRGEARCCYARVMLRGRPTPAFT